MKTRLRKSGIAFVLAVCGLTLLPSARAGTWFPLASNAPGNVQLMLLLTDGSVMCFDGNTTVWFRLSPNAAGSYINGSWTTLASMAFTRRYFSSQVLQNGKVIVAGAEYGTGCATSELYDPVANTWTQVAIPGGLLCTCPQGDGSCGAFRDSGSILLPNGQMLVAPVNPAVPNQTLVYNPIANSWTGGSISLGNQNEATWLKLPDDSILTLDKNTTQSERFVPSLNRWINDANAPVNLYGVGAEIGPALLLPNGSVFFLGGNSNTALYTPSGSTNPGTWFITRAIPAGLGCPDAPAAMLSNGNILFSCNPVGFGTNTFLQPTSFYEYVPATDAYLLQNSPTGGLTQTNISSYNTAMLCLPDGTVLYSSESPQLYVYVPTGPTITTGKPTITSISQNGDGSFHLVGTRLTGNSQGASYGDDEQMDSNYPLVRLTDGINNVDYARTYNWSSTGVATGNAQVSTEFAIPVFITQSGGPYSLVVVANGIASDPVGFPGPVWVDFSYAEVPELGTFTRPYKTLSAGANAVTAGGNLTIKPGAGNEALTISKPMTIVAVGGPATIGQ